MPFLSCSRKLLIQSETRRMPFVHSGSLADILVPRRCHMLLLNLGDFPVPGAQDSSRPTSRPQPGYRKAWRRRDPGFFLFFPHPLPGGFAAGCWERLRGGYAAREGSRGEVGMRSGGWAERELPKLKSAELACRSPLRAWLPPLSLKDWEPKRLLSRQSRSALA